jgi:TonB-linked SusC/RagA family outer membrane protein
MDLLADKSNSNLLGSEDSWALRGYFYRVNYNYNEKYYLQLAGRYDGSSRFPKGDRYGFFPAYSAGWMISKETFFKPLKNIFNEFKLRFSYGTLGNQNVADFGYISSLGVTQLDYLDANDKYLQYVHSPAPVSSSLTWERVTTKDIGLDIRALDNRLTVNLDGYIRATKGMLTKGSDLPAVFGASVPKQNAANLRVYGYEVKIGWEDGINIGGGRLNYHIDGNLTDFTGYVTKFYNPQGLLSEHYKGEKIGTIWGYVYDGFFKTDEEAQQYNVDMSRLQKRRINSPNADVRKLSAGTIKIIDLNGDGMISDGENTLNDPGDRTIIGDSQPGWIYGFQMGASYKGVSVNASFDGIGRRNYYPNGHNILFWSVYARPYASFIPKNFKRKIWSPSNPNSYFPRLLGYEVQNGDLSHANSMYLQNLAYITLRSLTIGYELPLGLINKIGLSKAKLFINGYNLFTYASGYDTNYENPQAVIFNRNGRDYPLWTSYSFGVSITF